MKVSTSTIEHMLSRKADPYLDHILSFQVSVTKPFSIICSSPSSAVQSRQKISFSFMAHIQDPIFRLNPGEGTSTQVIPRNLAPSLEQINEQEPDEGKPIAFFRCKLSTFSVWSKNETNLEKLRQARDWYNPNIPIQDQGRHPTCWAVSGSENIGEIRAIHSVDNVYTPYSGQYLVDFVDPEKAKERHKENKSHWCYGKSSFKGLSYAMNHGMPTRDAWIGSNCGSKSPPNRNLSGVPLKHVLNDVRCFRGVNKALDYLKIQPILGSLAIFNPDFSTIKGNVYRGPTSKLSEFSAWHTVSLRSIKMENGETIAMVKNSHGTAIGVGGYVKVSMDVMLLELQTKECVIPFSSRLFRSFTYGEVRTEFECEVVECFVDGQKKNELFVTPSQDTTFMILEGIFNNTSGNVIQTKDGENEIIGSPIDRALFKWAIQLQSNKDFNYSKSGSSTIKGSSQISKQKCIGIVVNHEKNGSRKGIRVHWKGNAAFLLGKCTKYDSNGRYLKMNETKETQLKEAIKDMSARKLISVALAFKEIEKKDFPRNKKGRERWDIPCDDLVLLAIFGIKNPCLLGKDDMEMQACREFEDGVEENASIVHLANLAEMADSTMCPSISEGLKKSAVGAIAAVDNYEEKLNYDQVFVRDFVPNALAFLMNKEPQIVRNFILKTLLQSWEKKIDRFQLVEEFMPASFKVFRDPVRIHETLIAYFGRVAPVDYGFWWTILLRAYTKSTECQKSIRLILSMCLSEGFDIFPTLLCADGCCMIDRGIGVYGYPIEIQALFFMALRCAVLLLKQDGEGTEMVEQIVKRLHALSYHMRSYFWLDLNQLNDICRYKTQQYSHTCVNKFNVIPDSLPEWILSFHGGFFVSNVSPTRMDFRWFALGNCIALLSSLATPEQLTAIMDLIESCWEELVGEMPLKVCYPPRESRELRIVTGCDAKNTRWSYHNGGSWPVLLWLLRAVCIKTGRPLMARRAIEVAEARLHKDHWPVHYDGKLGRYEQERKCQTWSIAGYLVPEMMLDDGKTDTQFSGQTSSQATGYVEEEKLVALRNGG